MQPGLFPIPKKICAWELLNSNAHWCPALREKAQSSSALSCHLRDIFSLPFIFNYEGFREYLRSKAISSILFCEQHNNFSLKNCCWTLK